MSRGLLGTLKLALQVVGLRGVGGHLILLLQELQVLDLVSQINLAVLEVIDDCIFGGRGGLHLHRHFLGGGLVVRGGLLYPRSCLLRRIALAMILSLALRLGDYFYLVMRSRHFWLLMSLSR